MGDSDDDYEEEDEEQEEEEGDDDDDDDSSGSGSEDELSTYVVKGKTGGLSKEGRKDADLLESVMETGEEAEAKQPEQQEDDEGEEKLSIIAQAKSLIELFEKEHMPGSKAARSDKFSYVWKHVKCFRLAHADALEEIRQLDVEAFNKIVIADQDPNKYMYCCKICYENPTVDLWNCFKMGQKSGPGNTTKHVRQAHGISGPDDVPIIPPIRGTKRSSPSVSSSSQRRKKIAQAVNPVEMAMYSSPLKAHVPKRSVGSGSGGSGNKISVGGSTISSKLTSASKPPPLFQAALQQGTVNAWDDYNFLLHQFVNNNNIPTRVVTDPKSCPEFFDFIYYVQQNGKNLRGIREKSMKYQAYCTYKKKLFEGLLAAFAYYVSQSRDHYRTMLKKDHPFISIGHDVWDSTQKEVLGVTVFFYDPVIKKCMAFPIGLETVLSKKADSTVDQTLTICEAAGILPGDLFKATNDTCTTALKVGRLLTVSKENGTCGMHQAELAFEHATGMKVRKSGKKVVDSFDDLDKLYKKSLKAARYIMEKRSKARFVDYQKSLKADGRIALKLALPNATRCAGAQIHFESMIRARWNLYNYWHKNPRATALDNDEFVTVADVAAVLHPMMFLIKKVQTNHAGAQAYTLIYMFRTFVLYWYKEDWWCPDVDKSNNVDVETHWNGDAQFPTRNWQGRPMLAGSNDDSYNSGDRMIGLVRKSMGEMEKVAQLLVPRLRKELESYGAKPTKDRLLGLACNPFTATHGVAELSIGASVLNDVWKNKPDREQYLSEFAPDFKQLAMQTLENAIREICSEILPEVEQPSADKSDDRRKGPVDAMSLARARLAAATCPAKDSAATTDPVKKQIAEFFSYPFDPRQVLRNQKRQVKDLDTVLKKLGNDQFGWVEHLELIAEHFDVMEWWENHGKQLFPLIYVIACLILPLPDSNGHQERTFSAATWMDGKLRKRQSDMTFQMKVLLYKNKEFLWEHRARMKELNLKEAANRTRRLLDFRVEYDVTLDDSDGDSTVVDLDEETDQLLWLYSQEEE